MMSRTLFAKISFYDSFYSKAVSRFLFSVVNEGCTKSVAITAKYTDFISCRNNECWLLFEDSFNFGLVTPLIGADEDGEVIEYRNRPLPERLTDLQELFSYIMEQEIVKRIEVFLSMNYSTRGCVLIKTNVTNFTSILLPVIYAEPEYHHKILLK